jgi:hypothetical protein
MMSDEPSMSFANLGLVPGRKVTFTVDGDRVVEDPPTFTREEIVANRAAVALAFPDLVVDGEPPTFEHLKRTVTKELAGVIADVFSRPLFSERNGLRRLAQLGVPGCRCGCSDGRRTP